LQLKNEFSRLMELAKDEIVKLEIVEQAQKLFQQYGLKKTTMDEIAAACGKAKSTLYHYYKSKEEVFDEVLLKEMNSLRNHVEAKVQNVDSIRKKIVTYMIEFHKEAVQRINLYRILKQEMTIQSVGDKAFKQLANSEKSFLVKIINENFDQLNDGFIKRDDVVFFAELMIAAFMGIVRYTIDTDNNFDTDKLRKSAEFIVSKMF